jgi:hypothetical protein
MTQDEIDNWRTCANALFGAARVAKTPDNLLTEALRSMSHHHAIAALRVYREQPFKGFYLDRYLDHYREVSGTDAADADGRTDGREAAAARLAAESEYWRQAAERAVADQADEQVAFERLPAEHVAKARQRFEELNMQRHGERGLRLLALDMWNKFEPANWSGDAPRWGVGLATANRDRAEVEREVERERHFRQLLDDNGRLRCRVRQLKMRLGEAVDVA